MTGLTAETLRQRGRRREEAHREAYREAFAQVCRVVKRRAETDPSATGAVVHVPPFLVGHAPYRLERAEAYVRRKLEVRGFSATPRGGGQLAVSWRREPRRKPRREERPEGPREEPREGPKEGPKGWVAPPLPAARATPRSQMPLPLPPPPVATTVRVPERVAASMERLQRLQRGLDLTLGAAPKKK